MRRISGLVCITVSVLLAAGCGRNERPPQAAIETHADTLLGEILTDNYAWLRDETRSEPRVLAYLEAENEYAAGVMEHTRGLQAELYDEMVARIKETDQSVPVKRDDYYYYTRLEKGGQYDIYCRKHGSLDAPEEVLLDVNKLAEGLDYMDVGVFEVSPDHRTLALAVDSLGNERYRLSFMDIDSRRMYPGTIDSVATSLAWANDSRTVYYVRTNEAWRADKVFRHEIGGPPDGDALVYDETDEAFDVAVRKSRSRKYIFLNSTSESSSEYRFLDADDPAAGPRMVEKRRPDIEYDVYHHGPDFYIVTNDDALNFRLMRAPVKRPSRAGWTEVIGARDSVKLDGLDVFRDYIVLYEREDGLRQIGIYDAADGTLKRVGFPEPVYSVYPGENDEYVTDMLRFEYESLVTPVSVYDYNMKTGERMLRKQDEVAGYDPAQYECRRILIAAGDGASVPVSLVWRKGALDGGPAPLYLLGYGAYGISMDPYFSSRRVSLLDRGLVFAIAHIRGGGELGRQWYYDGRLLNKKHTFEDFIAVADGLVEEGYTSRSELVISGGSAGGLLIGAVLNMRPDLCRVAVADVPFVDVINTMLDESIPLTVTEFDEWGNPKEPEFFEYMLSYAPYNNIKPAVYPDMLVTASLYDTRVAYWEPAKWVARLRAETAGGNLVLLKTNMGAGHGGASGRYSALEETAFEFAFVLDRLGLAP
jgi:oligopeptidase B